MSEPSHFLLNHLCSALLKSCSFSVWGPVEEELGGIPAPSCAASSASHAAFSKIDPWLRSTERTKCDQLCSLKQNVRCSSPGEIGRAHV